MSALVPSPSNILVQNCSAMYDPISFICDREYYPYKPVSGLCLRELSEFCLPLVPLPQAKPLVSIILHTTMHTTICWSDASNNRDLEIRGRGPSDYEFEFSVLSMCTSKDINLDNLQTLCACSMRKTRTPRNRSREP